MRAKNTPDSSQPLENTPEWLRSFDGCEHYSDQEAIEVLQTLDILTSVFLRSTNVKMYNIDNQLIVSLNDKDTNQKLAA